VTDASRFKVEPLTPDVADDVYWRIVVALLEREREANLASWWWVRWIALWWVIGIAEVLP